MSDFRDLALILGGIALFGGGIYCLVGWGSSCKRCDKWFAREQIRRQIVKEEKAARDVERADRHYDKKG